MQIAFTRFVENQSAKFGDFQIAKGNYRKWTALQKMEINWFVCNFMKMQTNKSVICIN